MPTRAFLAASFAIGLMWAPTAGNGKTLMTFQPNVEMSFALQPDQLPVLRTLLTTFAEAYALSVTTGVPGPTQFTFYMQLERGDSLEIFVTQKAADSRIVIASYDFTGDLADIRQINESLRYELARKWPTLAVTVSQNRPPAQQSPPIQTTSPQ